MRRWLVRLGRWLLALAGLLALVLGCFAIRARTVDYPPPRYVSSQLLGAYHVHSTASDGRGSVEEIARAAARAGLQFVVLADHNGAPQPPQFVHGVLVLHAPELSTPVGHVVAFGLPRVLTPEERRAAPLRTLRELHATAVLAHPVQWKNPWRAWEDASGVAGLELYSADTMLREGLSSPFTRLIPAVGAYLGDPLHGLYTLVAAQPEATDRLLALSRTRPGLALCSVDAHGWPPYEAVFGALAMAVEAPGSPAADPVEAERWVLERLLRGDGHCTFRGLGPTAGFTVDGLGAGRTAPVGARLRVVLPAGTPPAEVELRVRGPATTDGETVLLNAAGPVQIEVWRKVPGRLTGFEWKPWIVPSPVLAQ